MQSQTLATTYKSNHFLITREWFVIFSPYTENHISLRQESLILSNKRLLVLFRQVPRFRLSRDQIRQSLDTLA